MRMTSLSSVAGAVFFAVGVGAPSLAGAQAGPGTLSGVVTNEAGRPLEFALVVLNPDGDARRADTDAQGRFRFERVRPGSYELRVLLAGYTPDERTLRVEAEGLEVTVVMQRPPFALDTLRVVARERGVLGTVVASESFAPLAKANVSVMGTRLTATTGPDGKFSFHGLKPGAYVIFTKAPGRLSAPISAVVPADSAVELLVSMKPMSDSSAKRLAMPLAEFDSRVRAALRTKSALVPRQELRGKRGTVASALRYAPSFARTGMRLPNDACIYVDGFPRPMLTADEIQVEQVDRVEVYGLRALTEGHLRPWPPGAPCGDPKGPRSAVSGVIPATPTLRGGAAGRFGLQTAGQRSNRVPMDDLVRVVVIWTKQ